MAHFAHLDENNVVKHVSVVSNDIETASGALGDNDMHADGETWCKNFHENQKWTIDNEVVSWKQTSYNAEGTGFRGNYAGIGATYMTDVETLGVAKTDIFISQQPYPSWVIGIQTAQWYPPTPPGDAPALTPAEEAANKYYIWNESNYNSNPSTAWVLT